MKKLCSLILSACFLMMFAACGNNSEDPNKVPGGEEEIVYPVYEDDKEVFLSAYMSPWKTDEEQYRWVKGSGLNHLYISHSSNAETMAAAIAACENVGVYTIPMTNWGRPVSESTSYKAYPVDMKGHEYFSGFNILDEPRYEDFDYLASEYQKYKVDFPDKVFYTNLFRPGNNKSGLSDSGSVTYDTYIKDFVEKVIDPIEGKKIMSMTLYPLLIDSVTKEKSIQNTHLTDLGKFAVTTKAAGATMYHFVQTISFGSQHHAPTEADIRFQVYCGMAFGSKGFQYFTYATPNINHEFSANDVGMISRNNTRTAIYYGVQAVNKELSAFDNVFLSFEWENIMLIDGELSETVAPGFELYRSNDSFPLTESTETLKSAQCSRDTLIGVMKDANGNDGYTVVNYTHPSYGLKDEIALEFSGCRALSVYVGGKEQRIEAGGENFRNGIFTADLAPGEGIFVIPVE